MRTQKNTVQRSGTAGVYKQYSGNVNPIYSIYLKITKIIWDWDHIEGQDNSWSYVDLGRESLNKGFMRVSKQIYYHLGRIGLVLIAHANITKKQIAVGLGKHGGDNKGCFEYYMG